jgi:MFS family permease
VESSAKDELVSAMNWLMIPGVIGPLVGPGLGAVILTYFGWQWIFLINVPIIMVSILLSIALIDSKRISVPVQIDFIGGALVAIAIFSICFAIIEIGSEQGEHHGLSFLVLFATSSLFYLRYSRKRSNAVLDFALLEIVSFRHALEAGTLVRIVLSASTFIVPIWLQSHFGVNPSRSAAILTFLVFGALASRFLGAHLMKLSNPKTISIAGTLTLVCSLSLLSVVPNTMSNLVAALLFALGLSASIVLMFVNAVSYVDIEDDKTGPATGLYTTVQQFTLSLGVAVGAGILGFFPRFDFAQHTFSATWLVLGLIAAGALLPLHALKSSDFNQLRTATEK